LSSAQPTRASSPVWPVKSRCCAKGWPSIRQLAQDNLVSIITVRRAYSELERKDLIYSRPGLGSFVAQCDAGKRRELQIELLRPLLSETVRKARELNIDPARLLDLLTDIIREFYAKGGEK